MPIPEHRFLRVIAAMVMMFALAAAPAANAAAVACAPAAPQPAPSQEGCGGCCTTMECCDHGSQKTPAPAAPAPAHQDALQALIALAASSRPVEMVLMPREREFPPASASLLGHSPDSHALLCVFLI